MSQVTPNVFVGGFREVMPGFDTYINLSDYEYPMSHRFRIADYPGTAPNSDQDLFLSMLPSILKKFSGRTMVFCNAGQQRSPAVLVAYLMWLYALPLGEAIQMLRNRRSVVFPRHITYLPALQKFEQQLLSGRQL